MNMQYCGVLMLSLRLTVIGLIDCSRDHLTPIYSLWNIFHVALTFRPLEAADYVSMDGCKVVVVRVATCLGENGGIFSAPPSAVLTHYG